MSLGKGNKTNKQTNKQKTRETKLYPRMLSHKELFFLVPKAFYSHAYVLWTLRKDFQSRKNSVGGYSRVFSYSKIFINEELGSSVRGGAGGKIFTGVN